MLKNTHPTVLLTKTLDLYLEFEDNTAATRPPHG